MALEAKQSAVFVDRDGTLNDDPGYIDSPERIKLYPFAAAAIRHINESGRKVVVITNQSAVARGMISEGALTKVNDHLLQLVAAEGARIDAIYYCPHHPEATDLRYRCVCDCRKPKPGMLLRAAIDLNLELRKSIVIGDRYLDVETAHSVGATGVLVLTGCGRREFDSDRGSWPRAPDLVSENLAEAVQLLLGTAT